MISALKFGVANAIPPVKGNPNLVTQPKSCIKVTFLIWVVLGGSLFLPASAWSQEEDTGLLRSLQTDSPMVENTYYLQATFNNDTSPYHGLYLYGEGLFALAKDWGVEANFPTLLTKQPLGQNPAVLGPIGLSLRYEAWHFGGWSSPTAGAFSIQGGGAYGFSNKSFPSVGSSWSLEALGGVRVGKFFLQGNYGYQGGIDSRVSDEWQANTSLGWRLGSDWFVQAEADFSASSGPSNGTSWSYIPQIAFQPGDWLFEFGESLNGSPRGFTEFMVARAL